MKNLSLFIKKILSLILLSNSFKKLSVVIIIVFPAFIVSAQNVGINTSTPQVTLDVKGNQRTGGINNFLLYDSLSGKISWTNSNLWVTNPQYLIKHSASSEGLYSNGAQLEYRNSIGNPIFFTNWATGNGYFSGKLGINTLNPSAKLHIYDGASGITPFFSARMVVESNSHSYINLLSPDPFETGILFGSGTNAASGVITYNNTNTPKGFTFSNNGNLTRMVIDNAGNVGMGTVTPAAKLEVTHNGASTYGTALLLNQDVIGNADGPKIQFKKTMTTSKSWSAGILNGVNVGTFVINEDGGTAGFGTPRFSITPGGNIGIGTGNALTKLHIQNGSSGNSAPFSPLTVESNTNTYINLLSPNANETTILFGKTDDASSGGIVYNNTANPTGFQFRVNGNHTAVTIGNNLNTSIGMPPTASRLSVGQYFGNPDVIGLYNLSLLGGYTYDWHIGFGFANRLYFTAGSTQVAYVDENNGTWVSLSDMNFKKNIRPISSVLSKLMQANPVSYQMKTQNNDEITFGFLAQELQKIFPEAVKQFDARKKQTLGISYTHLIPITVAAIQEQQHIIESMQQQIDELKKMVLQLLKK